MAAKIDEGGAGRLALVLQNHEKLPFAIRRYGCRFRCLQAIAEITMGQALTVEEIAEMFRWGSTQADAVRIDNAQTGRSEHVLINRTFSILGAPRLRGLQVGHWNDGRWETWGGDILAAWAMQIVHMKTGGPDGHFVLADKRGHVVFDPWDYGREQGPKMTQVLRRLAYRVFKGV